MALQTSDRIAMTAMQKLLPGTLAGKIGNTSSNLFGGEELGLEEMKQIS